MTRTIFIIFARGMVIEVCSETYCQFKGIQAIVGCNQKHVCAEAVTSNNARRDMTKKVNVKFGRSDSLKSLSEKTH